MKRLCLLLWLMGSVPVANLAQIRIDHTITVVKDLDRAQAEYEALGFRVKSGRLHANGLLNAHIKFGNGTSHELMTVKGTPGDKMARDYQNLLDQGEGGVYLALTGHVHDSLVARFTEQGIEFLETRGKLWRYISFPSQSALAHLFFIEYNMDTTLLKVAMNHPNGMQAMAKVTLEGDASVVAFLYELGIKAEKGVFRTSGGHIEVVPLKSPGVRPRVLSVNFLNEQGRILEMELGN